MPYKNPEDRRKAWRRYAERHKQEIKQRIQEKALWFRDLKSKLSCKICGESDPATLDFHHRDPSQKDFALTKTIRRYGKETILREMEKCDILCANCHRKLHWLEQN